MRHYIKVDSEFFDAAVFGMKKQETRINDRGYRSGDVLVCSEVDSEEKMTGRLFEALVTHVVTSADLKKFGIMLESVGGDIVKAPAVIMSIEVLYWCCIGLADSTTSGAGTKIYREAISPRGSMTEEQNI